MMLPSRLGCPLSLKTPNMGNTGLNVGLTLLGCLPGMLHALLVVHEYKADKRFDRMR